MDEAALVGKREYRMTVHAKASMLVSVKAESAGEARAMVSAGEYEPVTPWEQSGPVVAISRLHAWPPARLH